MYIFFNRKQRDIGVFVRQPQETNLIKNNKFKFDLHLKLALKFLIETKIKANFYRIDKSNTKKIKP